MMKLWTIRYLSFLDSFWSSFFALIRFRSIFQFCSLSYFLICFINCLYKFHYSCVFRFLLPLIISYSYFDPAFLHFFCFGPYFLFGFYLSSFLFLVTFSSFVPIHQFMIFLCFPNNNFCYFFTDGFSILGSTSCVYFFFVFYLFLFWYYN